MPKIATAIVAIFWFALWGSNAGAQDSAALASNGAELAKAHCARCHVIDTKNVFGGISSSPSFPLLVNGLKDWEERMQSFHVRPPHPSIVRFKGETVDPNVAELRVPVILEYSDIDALVAYVRTLKKGE